MLRLLALILITGPAAAQDGRITDRAAFLDAVTGKRLVQSGIGLQVTPDGRIAGRALGVRVTGTWSWQDGFFCRTLDWGMGSRPLNCQVVVRRGDALIFTADRGAGDSETLRLD